MNRLTRLLDSLCGECHGTKVRLGGGPCSRCAKPVEADKGFVLVNVGADPITLVPEVSGGNFSLHAGTPTVGRGGEISLHGGVAESSFSNGVPFLIRAETSFEQPAWPIMTPKPTVHYRLPQDSARRMIVLEANRPLEAYLRDVDNHPLLYGYEPYEVMLIADLVEEPPANGTLFIDNSDGWNPSSNTMRIVDLPAVRDRAICDDNYASGNWIRLTLIPSWELRPGELLRVALRALSEESFQRARDRCRCDQCKSRLVRGQGYRP